MATFPTDGPYPLPPQLKTYIDATTGAGGGSVSSSNITDATTFSRSLITAANAAAAIAALGIKSGDVGTFGYVRQVTLGSYPARPAGTNPHVYFGVEDPTIVTTPGTTAGGGGYVDGTDVWWPANVI